MKKLLSLILPALLCAGSIFSQTSTVSGTWERGKPKAVELSKIVNGNLSKVASSEVGENGSFTLTFTPAQEGYYVLGAGGGGVKNHYTFYLKPGDPLNVNIKAAGYELTGKNTAENQEMARWHDFIFPLEEQAVYSMGKNITYVDFFPLMEEKLAALASYKVGKTKNKAFDASFADFRQFDLLANALQFIYSPRSAHPQDEDYIDYYRQIDIPAMTQTTAILNYPNGVHLLVNAYMISVKFSQTMTAADKESWSKEGPVASLLKDAESGKIVNNVILGELVLMFGQQNKTLSGVEEYKAKYGKYIVTPDQKNRWEHLGDRIKQSMAEHTKPIDFTFPDVNGTDVSLSDFRGKVVYIDIWATWCGPCKREMPFLKTLEAEYKDNNEIVFMGISVDASKDIQKWKDFLVKEGLPGVQLFGGDISGVTLSKPFKITGIPRFMLVGKDGKLLYADAVRPSSPEVRAVLNDAIMAK